MVYVLDIEGKPLMPTERHGKVRRLLKQEKAIVVELCPFTIRLTYKTTSYKQDVTLGVDTGAVHVGLSATSNNRELYSSEVILRNNIVDLISTRRELRRIRRNRLRYRKMRFNNRIKSKRNGWISPSVRYKIESHINVINNVCSILPISKIIVEVAQFDTQKIKKPDIKGKEYQEGPAKGLDGNNKAYVRVRDNYTCWNCKTQTTDGEAHHLIPVSEGGPTVPENMVYLCKECHHKVTIGELVLNLKGFEGYKDMSHVNVASAIVLKRAIRKYGEDRVEATFGYITNEMRNRLGLKKAFPYGSKPYVPAMV